MNVFSLNRTWGSMLGVSFRSPKLQLDLRRLTKAAQKRISDLFETLRMSVTLITLTGPIKIELKYVDDEQVKHVENFVRHCAIGTYDNNSILRYIPDFILQTGDSTNSGKNSTIADLEHHLGEKMSPEFTKTSPQPLSRGVVYAVNHEETLYGSQFFIVLSDLHKASLENNPSYTVIGAVIDGFEAIAGIEKDDLLEVKKNGKPRGKWKDKIWLEGVRVHNNPFAW